MPADGLADSRSELLERLADLEQSVYGKLERRPALAPAAFAPPAPPRQLANPAPLGLLGFAVASVLAGVLKLAPDPAAALDGAFAASAFFLGGAAQLFAAVFSLLHNHTHAATTFAVYGLHWMATGLQLLVRSLDAPSFAVAPTAVTAVAYNLVLAAVTLALWVPTFRMNLVLNTTLVALALVFILDVPAAYGSRGSQIASGVFQCIAGALGLYAALLDLVNETWRRPVLPLFAHRDHREDYQCAGPIAYVPKHSYHKSLMSAIHL